MAQEQTGEIRPRELRAESLLSSADPERIRFMEPFLVLAKRKKLVLLLPVLVGLLTAAVSLFLPKVYTAATKLMPPQQSQSVSSVMLGQLGPLAGLAGKDLGLRNPSDLYITMLHSETVSDAIINRFNLMAVYKAKRRVDARRALESRTEISAGKEGVISISVADREPERAAAIANGYVDELQKLIKTLAVTEAGKRRLFFEQEVQNASDELGKAEDALRATQEKSGIIQIDSQSKAMIESLTSLQGQVAAKEARVRAMRGFATEENPQLIREQRELDSMRKELALLEAGQVGSSITDVAARKVPAAAQEYVRKLREVKFREVLLEVLSKEYEAARIDESKDAAVIQVLDRALPPEERSWPHRSVMVLVAVFVAFFFAVVMAFVLEALDHAKREPRFLAELDLFRCYLRERW